MDMKIEVVVIPVADVDRSRDFYQRLGWRLDVTPPTVVQLTPPGSACSVQFGPALSSAAPGSAKSYLVVADLEKARSDFAAAGVEVGEVFHIGPSGLAPGFDPERRSYSSRASLRDPDGNEWLLQEVTTRLPGRVDAGATSYGSVADLANAMRRASTAHGEHEKRIGHPDPDWPDWYAEFMTSEQSGAEPPK